MQCFQLKLDLSSWIFPLVGKQPFPVSVFFHLSPKLQPSILSLLLCAPKLSQWIYEKGPASSCSCGRKPSPIHFLCAFSKGSWSVLRGTSSSDVHGLGRINEGSCQCNIYRILVLVRWSNSSRNPLIQHPSNVRLRRLYPTISVHFHDWPAEQES